MCLFIERDGKIAYFIMFFGLLCSDFNYIRLVYYASLDRYGGGEVCKISGYAPQSSIL